MKVIDCFIFYNELQILEFRLDYLYDSVDYFVLVESTVTFAGNPKPLFFNENKHKFSKYNDKIIHIIVTDTPIYKSLKTLKFVKGKCTALEREIFQRNCIDRGLLNIQLKDDDLILISDVDEIPDRNTLSTLNLIESGIHTLLQDFYYYNFSCKTPSLIVAAKILRYSTYTQLRNPHAIRRSTKNVSYIEKGGWHLSYFGSSEFISNKIKQFSHQEYNSEEYTNITIIDKKMRENIDLFGRDIVFKYIPIEENTYLPEGYNKLIHLLS